MPPPVTTTGAAVCRFPPDKEPPILGQGGPPRKVTVGAWPAVLAGMGGRELGATACGRVGESLP